MFTPDKLHIHHRLLSLGWSHRSAVLILYAVSFVFAFSAFLFMQVDTVQRSLTITFILGLTLIILIKRLHYYEMAIFNNGLIMPFFEKWALKQSKWIPFADAIFIAISYSLSCALVYLVNPSSVTQLNFGLTLVFVLSLQLSALWITGLYREKMNPLSIANVLHMTASIGSAVGLTGISFLLMESLLFVEAIQLFIFDFYFLLTFLFAHRIGYQALRFWFHRDKKTGENVLIYGTGDSGTMILQNILHSSKKDQKVLGFLDDDPGLEGKLIHGYPILGGHWALSRTHRSQKIDSIYLCEEDIPCENLSRLRTIAHQRNITIKKLRITLQKVEDSIDEEILLKEEPKELVQTM